MGGVYVPIWQEDRKKLDSRRVGAFVVDAAVLALLLIPLNVFFDGLTSGAWLVFIALQLGYFHLCESLSGQTIGKHLFDLRVVRKADAGPASAAAISGRTVLRLLDALPFAYLIGLATMLLSGQRRQRLGDLAAGTVVTRASARPYTPARRSALQAGYPGIWLAAAVAVVLIVGHGGDPGLATLDRMCQQTEASYAALPSNRAPDAMIQMRMAMARRLYATRPTSKKMQAVGSQLIRDIAEEYSLAVQGETDGANHLLVLHQEDMRGRGLKHC